MSTQKSPVKIPIQNPAKIPAIASGQTRKGEISQLNQYLSTVLIKISGRDHPGITASVTEILAHSEIRVLDMTQAVINQLLSLSFLVEINLNSYDIDKIKTELLNKTEALDLRLEFETLIPDDFSECKTSQPWTQFSSRRPKQLLHYALTLLADPISLSALHQVTQVLANFKVNIDFIKKLSEHTFSCVEMGVSVEIGDSQIQESELRKELLLISKSFKIDIALQAEGIYRKAKRLVILDMDSTLIQSEVIDELAREKGVYAEISEITQRTMMGEMNFTESLRLRCQALKGLTEADLERVYQRIELTPGAEPFIHILKKLGYKIAVISGGFTFVAEKLKQKLGLNYAYANVLEIQDGVVTGQVLPPIIDAQRKADLLEVIAQLEKIEPAQVIAVGDGANDLLMLDKAGLGIAFNAKMVVREKADLALSQKNMQTILYLLGFSEREILEALP